MTASVGKWPLCRLFALLQGADGFLDIEAPVQDTLLCRLRRSGLLGVLACAFGERLAADHPDRVVRRLYAAALEAGHRRNAMRWELAEIAKALAPLGIPVILLKGAAYELEGLAFARGRPASDVDVLVATEHLIAVEGALKARGWVEELEADYDRRYYREWMHELPPLRHRHRGTLIDVHHRLLPRTSRLQPDTAASIAAARPLAGAAPFALLSPEDTVLHKCTHLCYDGDFSDLARELWDLDGLLRTYGREPGFWERLAARGRDQDLLRPLWYGLRFARRLAGTPVPDEALKAAREGRPNFLAGWVMDVLVARRAGSSGPLAGGAAWLLYVRSHWLRMPPLLLARHLLIKTRRRIFGRGPAQARPESR